jgi:hypothetical protein
VTVTNQSGLDRLRYGWGLGVTSPSSVARSAPDTLAVDSR